MTNAQKWIIAFLVLFVAIFVLQQITGFGEEEYEEIPGYVEENMQQQESGADEGLSLLTTAGCTSCHGPALEGTKMGPSLVNVSEHWDRGGLINYLRNPSGYDGGDRFDQYRMQYKNIVMPSYDNLSAQKLGDISDYLLSLSK